MLWRAIKSLFQRLLSWFGIRKRKVTVDSDSSRLADIDISVPPYSPASSTKPVHPVNKRSFETLPLDSESDREIDATVPESPPRRGLFRRR